MHLFAVLAVVWLVFVGVSLMWKPALTPGTRSFRWLSALLFSRSRRTAMAQGRGWFHAPSYATEPSWKIINAYLIDDQTTRLSLTIRNAPLVVLPMLFNGTALWVLLSEGSAADALTHTPWYGTATAACAALLVLTAGFVKIVDVAPRRASRPALIAGCVDTLASLDHDGHNARPGEPVATQLESLRTLVRSYTSKTAPWELNTSGVAKRGYEIADQLQTLRVRVISDGDAAKPAVQEAVSTLLVAAVTGSWDLACLPCSASPHLQAIAQKSGEPRRLANRYLNGLRLELRGVLVFLHAYRVPLSFIALLVATGGFVAVVGLEVASKWADVLGLPAAVLGAYFALVQYRRHEHQGE